MKLKQLGDMYNSLQDDLSKEIFLAQIDSIVGKNNGFFFSNGIKELKNSGNGDLAQEIEGKKIVLFGAGLAGTLIARAMKHLGYSVLFFCDNDKEKHGKYVEGILVESPDELLKYKDDEDLIVIITIYCLYNQINKQLKAFGIHDSKMPKALHSFMDITYFTNVDFLKFNDDEIFVDCGAYDGEDIKKFIKHTNGKYKKAIAFEPDPNNYILCKELLSGINNLEIYNAGVYNKHDLIKFSAGKAYGSNIDENGNIEVPTLKIDDIMGQDGCTFIKMDIEGAELAALEGAKDTIKKFKPKLAISVYHKSEDIYEIQKYLSELVPEYKFWLRHYSLAEIDIVLFAQV